jgi:trk system potassium uptake protein
MQASLVKYVGSLAVYPARSLFAWYGGLACGGTLLLLLPVCHAVEGRSFSLSEALFTAASAASVTGLMVISVENDLSFVGQLIVLLLIQLGGLGVMSMGTLLFVSVTGRQPVQFHLLTHETLGVPLGADVGRLILLVAGVTLALEGLGTIALLLARLGDGPLAELLWWALFHSVSGFCNAGISLQDASLASWSGDAGVILTMTALIVAGGLGFPVLIDLFHLRRDNPDRRSARFHTKLVLAATAVLLTGGAVAIWLLERNQALADMNWGTAVINALFQSATARTAGFTSVPVESLAYPSLFLIMMLMFIGGNSCSTAGGVKVSTVAVLALEGTALLRRRWQAAAFGRRVPQRILRTAAAVLAVYALVLLCGIFLLLLLETRQVTHLDPSREFLDLVFEAFSALGTVGLSTGATGELGEASRLVVAGMMLLGRVGPLAMASMLLRSPRGPKIRYPESEVVVG